MLHTGRSATGGAIALCFALWAFAAGAPVAYAWSAWDVGDLRRVSTTPDGDDFSRISWAPVMSADGRFVVFWSAADLLPGLKVPGNIFRRNLATGQLRLVSVNASGDPANRLSGDADVSADGRYVVFRSAATNLTSLNPGKSGIFLKDMVSGEVTMVSAREGVDAANAPSFNPTISPDATQIAFDSTASNLTEGDDNGWSDIFLADLSTSSIRQVSTASTGAQSNNNSSQPVVAKRGVVLFQSLASNLSERDSDACVDLFVWSAASVRRMVNLPCPLTSEPPYTISGDGRVVAFDKTVLTIDTNARWTPKTWGVIDSLSTTGRFASFDTSAQLVPRDRNGVDDIYVRDLQSDTWILATVSSDDHLATRGSPYQSSLSGNASYLAFTAWDTDLVRNDDNDRRDVFVVRLR